MPILRSMGRGKKRKLEVLKYIEYAAGFDPKVNKHLWKGHQIPWTELVIPYGLPIDPIAAAEEIIGLHEAFNTAPSENMVYHFLLDFKAKDGLSPWDVVRVAWDINGYLRARGIAYYQGVHCSTQREEEHPHAHTIVNALCPLTGRRLQVNHAFLIFFKDYANSVLGRAGLPLIKIGRRSLPFRIVFSSEEDME